MKTIGLIIGLACCPFLVFSQEGSVKVAGKIYYTTSHLYDTIDNKTFVETSILYFGANESLFRSYDNWKGIEASKKKATEPGSMGIISGRGTTSRYYTNLVKKEITRVQTDGITSIHVPSPNYVMPEKMDKIKWQIIRETKKIGGYTCQKATGVCRGRLYTAWFTADIPYSFGPFKLNGLPGLIMEAEDSRAQVVFRFERIEIPLEGIEYIEPIANPVVTTETDFERMRETPPGNNATSPAGTTVTGGVTDAQGKPIVWPKKDPKKIENNNPMDLVSKLPRVRRQ